MGTLVNRWLRANKDKIDNINFCKGEFYQVKEVSGLGYYTLTNGRVVKADCTSNWTIMPENFHPDDPKELAGRYLLCVKHNNWSDVKGRPSIGEHVMISNGDLGNTICNLLVTDIIGRTSELSKDRLLGLDPEYKLMAIGFDPNKINVKSRPLTPDECYPADPGNDYTIGCSITIRNDPFAHRVIGKNNEGVIISTLAKVGFKITDSHCKYYSIDTFHKGLQAEFLPYSFIKPYLPQWDVSNVPTISDVIPAKGCSNLQDFENPLHSSKWEFPKGSMVDYGDRSLRVIGKSDSFPDRYLLLSNNKTQGVLIKSDWLEPFHVDTVYLGRFGIWTHKQALSFTKGRPENKHELDKYSLLSNNKTSLEDDPVTRKVKPPKFQHKRTAY